MLKDLLEFRNIVNTKDIILIEKCGIKKYEINTKISFRKFATNNRHINFEEKKIISILNKLTELNYDKLYKETLTLNYNDPKIVDLIFKKAVAEPFFLVVYTRFCSDLGLHELLNEKCVFKLDEDKRSNENLAKFICSLYKNKIIISLTGFIRQLLEELNDKTADILLVIIKSVGDNDQFKSLIVILHNSKTTFCSRIKFLIEDLYKETTE